MRNFARVSLVMAGSAALVGSMALPASAADTTATVTVTGGTISIGAPTTGTATGEGVNGIISPDTVATIVLEDMRVTDERAIQGGWEASVSLGAFEGDIPENIMLPDSAGYTAGQATPGGTVTVTAQAPVDLTTLTAAAPVQTATAVSGNNTATWDATLEIETPAQALADTYEATLTHSVS